MQIPQQLPQFKNVPTLFIVAGQFEVNFLVAQNGEIEKKEPIQVSMREEGQEKQIYQHGNAAPELMGAVSHYGAYHRDLIDKVHRETADRVYNLIYDEKIANIYIFAPEYALSGIAENLKTRAKEKIRKTFEGEFTKLSPTELLTIFDEKITEESFEAKSEEEEKILEKPTTGTRLKI